MIIVIDGYNLLKLIHSEQRISETQRSAFVNLLGRYSAKRGHKVHVVYDAGPCVYPSKEKQRGITIHYSGEYQSADDLIMSFCEDHKGKEILVVTADREIISHVETYSAEVVDPKTFYDKVKEAFALSEKALKKKQGNIVKISKNENSDIDALMLEAAGMNVPSKDEGDEYDIPRHHQPKVKEVTRRQRKRISKIEKL
jgi:predicted RNA-binding protein with PIN domain